nr:transforming acidic coiled-coil-containing protein 3 isoform X2 [Geotrypetes seraphini]XP_033806990.1 transforming acidic coiled-coil-containing protein 3 isoform X2 [Geotrypetes seraphini]
MSLQINDENCRNDITTESCDFLLTPQQPTGRPSILRPSQKENLPPKSAVKAMKVTFQTPMRDPQTQRILSPNMTNKQEAAFTLDDCAAALENLHINVSCSSECMLLVESVKMSQEHDGQTAPYLHDDLLVKSGIADCINSDSVDELNPSNPSPKMENSPSKVLFSPNVDSPEKDPSYLQVADALCHESAETIPVENNCTPVEIVDLSTEIKPVIKDLSELVTESTCNIDIVSANSSTAATKVLNSPPVSKGSYKFDPGQIDLIDPFKPRELKLQNSPVRVPESTDSCPEFSKESVNLEINFSDDNTVIRKLFTKNLVEKLPEINDGAKKPTVVKNKVEKIVNREISEDTHVLKASCTIDGNWCDSDINSFTSECSKIPNSPKLQKPGTENLSIRQDDDNLLLKKPESVLGCLIEEKPVICDNLGKKDPLSLCSNLVLKDQKHDAGCCAPYPDELPVKSQGTCNMAFNSLEELNLSKACTNMEVYPSKAHFSPIMDIPAKDQNNLLDVYAVAAAAESIIFNSAISMAEDDCPHGRAVDLSKPAINDLSEFVTKSSCNEITIMDTPTAARKVLESPSTSKASYNFDPDQIDLIDPFKMRGSKLQNSPVGVSQSSERDLETSKAESFKLEFDFTDGNTVIRKSPPKRLGERPPVMKDGAKKRAVIKEKCGSSKTSSSPKLQRSSTRDLIGKESENLLLQQNVFVPASMDSLDQPDISESLKHVEPLKQEIQVSAIKGTSVALSEGQVKELNMEQEPNPLDCSSSKGNLTSVSDRKAFEGALNEDRASVKPGSDADASVFEMDFKPATEFEGLCQPIEIDYLEQFGSSSFKESALRKQSLYLKFDPLLRESPRKTHASVQETKNCLTNVSFNSCSGTLELETENAVHVVEPLQNEEKPKGLDLLGTFTIAEPSALIADISPKLFTPALPFLTVDAIVEVLQYSQKDMDAAIDAVQLKVQEKEIDVLQWKNKHEKLLMQYAEMGKIVAEYECTITQMIEDSHKQKEVAKLDIQKILQEKQQLQDDFNSMEKSYSELFKRFDKQKDVLEGYRKNEEALKKCVEDYVTRISKEEQRYQALKAHAEEKLKRASEEIAQVRSKTKGEIAALQASLRKEQMKIKSMEQSLEQKAKENDELTKICDDLISKMERSC